MALLSFLPATASSVLAQESSPESGASWSVAERREALVRTERVLDNYFYPDRVAALKAIIEANRQSLLQIPDQKTFAKTLTSELQDASGDKHLIVWYSDKPINKSSALPSDAAAETRFFQHIDYGFNSAARLTGNIGYLNLGGFANMPAAKSTLDAAMALLSATDAIIIDLRGNGGGDSDTVAYLLGYFFARPIEITGAVVRKHGKFRTDRDFTAATVGGRRYLGKPVFVLIDHQTISAGEMFAYDLKTLHRALILGEPSAGAAMGLGSPPFVLTEHLSISVPDAETRNPYTGTNWDGTGVVPDVATSAKGVLLAGYKRALESVHDRYDPMNELPEALHDPAAALKASFPDVSTSSTSR
jgi:hypothetical protein